MSIPVLTQVYEEARRLSIAGSGLAVGDFRLKKLVNPLRTAGKKAPVFAKVADGIEQLVDGTEQAAPQALLELSSLVLAILYTQGQTGETGSASEIETLDVEVSTTQVSSRVLKPLLEALTTTGSGRLETVSDAHQRGAFKDLRLVNAAIQSLDDVYPELADFMAENVLPSYGAAIIPEIKHRIDIQGKAGNVRRLKLLYQLDPVVARPLVEAAFEKGSKEMKIAALGCLGDSKHDLPHLLEQATAKAKTVRQVALERLAKYQGKDVEAVFEKALAGVDAELLFLPISETTNSKLVKLAQTQTRACFEELLATKEKKKAEKLVNRLDVLLCCFYGRNEKTTTALLEALFESRSQVAKQPGGEVLLDRLCSVMVASSDKRLLQLVAGIHAELDDKAMDTFGSSVLAVLATRSPKHAFDELQGYYTGAKRRRGGSSRSEIISGLLNGHRPYGHPQLRYHHHRFQSMLHDRAERLLRSVKWDPRWLDLAIENDDAYLVCTLATTKNKAAGDYLVNVLGTSRQRLDHWETTRILAALIDLQHKQATDLLIDVVKKLAAKKGHRWLSFSVIPLIAQLPSTAVKKIEGILEGLPESLIDDIMPQLMSLKQKAK